jgi:hypothetical protein
VAILLADGNRSRDNGTAQITAPDETVGLIDQLRAAHVVLTYDPDTRALRTSDAGAAAITVAQAR